MFLAQMPTPQMPDLPPGPSLDRVRGPIGIPLFEPWQIALMAGATLVLFVLFIWGIIRFLRARKNSRQPPSPSAIALAELDSAATLTSGDDERFAVLTSLALRRYFETAQWIPALGRTSLEFLKSLENNVKLTDEARASLAEFLEHCDRVKFARAALSEPERTALTNSAKQSILQMNQPEPTTQSNATTSAATPPPLPPRTQGGMSQ